MVPIAIFKENSHIFRKTHLVFFIKKPKISTFRETSLHQLLSTASLPPLALSKILKIFFGKTVFFSKRIQFLNTFRIPKISVAFYSKFATFSNFWKKNTCSFRKTPMFYLLKPNFERFEESYFFSRTLRQICYF